MLWVIGRVNIEKIVGGCKGIRGIFLWYRATLVGKSLSEPELPKQKKRPDTEPLPSVCYPYFTELKNVQNKANK